MRSVVVLIFILLTACAKQTDRPPMCYDSVDVVALTVEQTRLIGQLCGMTSQPVKSPAPAAATPQPIQAPARSAMDNLQIEAAKVGMTTERFMATEAGRLLVADFYWSKFGGAIIGGPMILMIWLIVTRLLRDASRSPTRIEERRRFGIRRFVVTQYQGRDIDGWFAGIMITMACVYTLVVYFRVIV